MPYTHTGFTILPLGLRKQKHKRKNEHPKTAFGRK